MVGAGRVALDWCRSDGVRMMLVERKKTLALLEMSYLAKWVSKCIGTADDLISEIGDPRSSPKFHAIHSQ